LVRSPATPAVVLGVPCDRTIDLRIAEWEHTFVDRTKEEVEQLRRSIAMLQPGAAAMNREDAVRLLRELHDVQARLDRLRSGLRALLEADG
jgi:hypothetical protein